MRHRSRHPRFRLSATNLFFFIHQKAASAITLIFLKELWVVERWTCREITPPLRFCFPQSALVWKHRSEIIIIPVNLQGMFCQAANLTCPSIGHRYKVKKYLVSEPIFFCLTVIQKFFISYKKLLEKNTVSLLPRKRERIKRERRLLISVKKYSENNVLNEIALTSFACRGCNHMTRWNEQNLGYAFFD